MKRLIYGLVLVLGIGVLVCSCKKDEKYSFTVPSGSILVSMPGATGTTSFDSYNIASISATSTPEGWVVDDIDLYNSTITVTAPSSFDEDEVKEGTLSLKGYTPQGSARTISIYLAILENPDVDYTASPANCYIANKPETRFVFDPCKGGNGIELETESVAVLWQTRKELIKYLDLRDGKASFYLEMAESDDDSDEPSNKVYEGNALIGGYDKSGELVWSWHIWVTNGDPTAETITLNGATMMNRNLGAFCNSEGSTDGEEIYRAYGMYYQWGNKNPFVGPQRYNFPQNEDDVLFDEEFVVYLDYKESSAETGTLEWSTLNPMALIKGNKDNGYDWLYEGHDNALWNEESKTDNDPCPAGWRVPAKSVFEHLTIVGSYDDMAWEDAQRLYGWMLEDSQTSTEHFFTAQGRRNYLDCRLDIFNDDYDLPVPWSGYYWTASTDGADASALYFDLNTATRLWNGFDAARAMHRANAMPVRCIRE